MTPAISRLVTMGYIQKHHGHAAEWLRMVPMASPEVHMMRDECFMIARRSHSPDAPLFDIIANWARKGTAFSMDEKSIGMIREGLNVAHRLMVKQAGRVAA